MEEEVRPFLDACLLPMFEREIGCSLSEKVNLSLQEWMRQANIEPWNTRIFKKESSVNSDTLPEYDVRIASSLDFPIETYNFEVCQLCKRFLLVAQL